MDNPGNKNDSITDRKGDSPPNEKLAQRREFLLRGGKILAYSVPVIVSFQATPLKAQMTGGSLGSPTPVVDPLVEETIPSPDAVTE